MKLYDLGLVVGRFQTLHLGHKAIIEHALEICNRVVVYVGSSQESDTRTNPFPFTLRKEMLEAVFSVQVASKQLLIRPLPDIGAGNNDIWGKYVLNTFEGEFHKQPDLYITGCEKERASWFTDELAPKMDELRIARNNIKISASDCRRLMLDNQEEAWKNLVPYEIHDKYIVLYSILKDVYGLLT